MSRFSAIGTLRPTSWYRKAALLAAIITILAGIFRALLWGEVRAYLYRNYTEVRVVDGSNWFDYPVGAPNARGYYQARRFGGCNLHLGEDWNGMGGGNSDYGDPVYAIADGTVSFSKHVGLGWGNVIRITLPVEGKETVEAVYAHLANVRVREGQKVKRGQVIGAIGSADGAYPAHLHFEIRTRTGLPLGGGYGYNPRGEFCDPSKFIDKHRIR